MKFSKEFLQDLLEGERADNIEIISNEINGNSRWSIHYEMIFKVDNKYYTTYYSVGATESQDERPYEYEDGMIECDEVEPYEVTITKYRKKT